MLAAILFDLDGTLVNTDPVHYQAWQEMLLRFGLKMDENFYKSRISGRLNSVILQDILPQLSLQQQEEFATEKEAMFRQLATQLQPLPGLSQLLAWTEEHQIKRALVTNAPRLNANFMLEVLGLTKTFSPIIIAEDEIAGKPHPAPYQAALRKLQLTPDQAIAIEDSPSGIRSAVGAGVRTIGITSTHEAKVLREVGAFMAVPDFTDLQLWTLVNSLLEADVVDAIA